MRKDEIIIGGETWHVFSLLNKRIPFDWENTFFGYSCVVIYQSILVAFLLHHVACFTSFALGAYLFLTFNKAYMIDELKSISKTIKDRKLRTNQLCNFIQMHADVKQLSEWKSYVTVNEIYQHLIILKMNNFLEHASIFRRFSKQR